MKNRKREICTSGTVRPFASTLDDGSVGFSTPETDGTSFTFLGFAHVWGKSRLGKNVVRQVTAKNRYARALAAITAWCRVNRHQSIPDQHAHLTAMMRGHYAYYGITGNFRRLSWYAHQVPRICPQALLTMLYRSTGRLCRRGAAV